MQKRHFDHEMSSQEKCGRYPFRHRQEATVPAADSATTQSSAAATAQTVTGTVDEENGTEDSLRCELKATDATINKRFQSLTMKADAVVAMKIEWRLERKKQ